MVETLGSTADVRLITGADESDLNDIQIGRRLDKATRRITTRLGRVFVDRFLVQSKGAGLLRVYELHFEPRDPVGGLTVYLDGVELSESSDYTYSDGKITLDSSLQLQRGEILVAEYVPDFWDDYANYEASFDIMRTSMLHHRDAESLRVISRDIKDALSEYEKLARSKPVLQGVSDHSEGRGVW